MRKREGQGGGSCRAFGGSNDETPFVAARLNLSLCWTEFNGTE